MMGIQQSEPGLFSYRINLETRVRKNHPLRRVLEVVDFSFVRREVAHFYGRNGNPSEDPAVIMKMMFLLFFDNVASERELMRVIPERLDYLWFLGYELDDLVPNHSVLSKARARWGAEVFERLFVQSVQRCAAAGLIAGEKLHMDSVLVDANASNDSIVSGGVELIATLRRLYQETEAKLEKESVKEAEAAIQAEGAADVPAPEAGKGKKGRKKAAAKTNQTHLSTTDPDSALARSRSVGARMRYKHHRGIDDAYGVITAVETTAGDVDEGSRLMPLVEQHQANVGKKVGTVIADSKYGIAENFIACQREGIRSHMADLAAKQEGTGRRAGIFSEEDFRYDASSDSYLCPAGQKLERRHWDRTRARIEYKAANKICAACPLRPQCTRNQRARTLHRHEQHHDLLKQARAQASSRAAKRDRRRRQHLMERSFADGANNHQLKRARWRRLFRQKFQEHLIAACQNIRILLAQSRRTPAGVVALGLCQLSVVAKRAATTISALPGTFWPLMVAH